MSPTTGFDYSPYLPRGGRPGKWLPRIPDAELHSRGYYLSKYWNMWYEEGCSVYEAEFSGRCPPDSFGVEKQICCGRIRLLRDVTKSVLSSLDMCGGDLRGGEFNTGVGNTGSRNTGSFNPGSFNTGNRNTGNLNTGDFNTGDCNDGIDNVGDNNSGSGNVGCRNTGHSNTGNDNRGSFNTGSFNIGHGNAGSFNSGSHNVGKWNFGNYNCGYFNTGEPFAVMFNRPTSVRMRDVRLPKWLNRRDCRGAFLSADPSEAEAALSLPNFDFSIFEEITGISKADFERKLGRAL